MNRVAGGLSLVLLVLAAGELLAEDAPPAPAKAPFDAATARALQEAWAKHLGTPVELTNRVGMRLVLIPPGEFLMGSSDEQIAALLKVADEIQLNQSTQDRIQRNEVPQHRVVLTRPFRISATEVTIGQYKQFTDATGYKTEQERDAKDDKTPSFQNPGYEATDDLPAILISWNDATAFCEWLTKQEPSAPGESVGAKYRLPTEAEWEYTSRAGATTAYFFGDDWRGLDAYAWTNQNCSGRPKVVAKKRPNAFGLYDMSGNAWEWCHDWYDEGWYSKSPTDDPTGPATQPFRVIRSGSYLYNASPSRSAYRGAGAPSSRHHGNAFRVVQVW